MDWVVSTDGSPTIDRDATAPQLMDLCHRSLAMLRAVATGRAEMSASREPDLFVDGLPCDYVTAHQLARAGLVRPVRPARLGQRVPAVLTDVGHAALRRQLPISAGASSAA